MWTGLQGQAIACPTILRVEVPGKVPLLSIWRRQKKGPATSFEGRETTSVVYQNEETPPKGYINLKFKASGAHTRCHAVTHIKSEACF